MNTMANEMRATYAFVLRNAHLTRRYLGWEIVFLVYTLVNTIAICLIKAGDPPQVLFLMIGSLLWAFLSLVFSEVAMSISWERWEGTIEHTFMAPIHRATYLFGQCIFGILYGVVRSIVILLVLAAFFDVPLERASFLPALAVIAVASLSFLGLGLMVATFPLLSPERGAQGTHIVQAVILLVSGVYYDVGVLPPWLRIFSYVSPGTYTLRAIRGCVLDGKGFSDIWGDMAILAGMGIVLIPLGLYVFGLVERHAKRIGTLKRSG